MNIDIKQVIIDLEHNIRKIRVDYREGYIECVTNLKAHPIIKKACAPQPGPKYVEKKKQEKEDPNADMTDRTGKTTCNFCGGEGYTWINKSTSDEPLWRLTDDKGKVHFCR